MTEEKRTVRDSEENFWFFTAIILFIALACLTIIPFVADAYQQAAVEKFDAEHTEVMGYFERLELWNNEHKLIPYVAGPMFAPFFALFIVLSGFVALLVLIFVISIVWSIMQLVQRCRKKRQQLY